MSYLDQIKDPNKNYKFGLGAVECKHEFTQDFTYGRRTDNPIEHIHCIECGWHKFRGVEYTRDQWNKWINSPNPEDPEYDKLLTKAESVTANG